MKKVAFLFPGVGSQYVGMSQSLYDNFNVFKETIREASDILKLDIPGMTFSPGNKKELDTLENAQCTILAFSTATYRVFMEEVGIEPHYCMGHSLGEYSALCCAGAIQFPDALSLVKQRGLIVKEVSAGIEGTMMWVINLDIDIVETLCRETSKQGQAVHVSAFDSPTQCSISGHTDVLMTIARELEKKGAIVYPLKLSGPFHSPLMSEAAEKMRSILDQYNYNQLKYPVIANRNAQPYKNADIIIDNLSQQLTSPIRWQASIQYLLAQDVEIAIEIGPKNVLKFLMPKNTDKILTFTTDNQKDLDLISKELILQEKDYLEIIGKCLGAAVSTKNRNDNETEYEENVIKPYRKIESFYNKFVSNGQKPDKNHVKDALHMLQTILAAKKVPPQEQEYWLNRIIGDKIFSF